MHLAACGAAQRQQHLSRPRFQRGRSQHQPPLATAASRRGGLQRRPRHAQKKTAAPRVSRRQGQLLRLPSRAQRLKASKGRRQLHRRHRAA